jgi:hypothetical protein
MMTSHISLSAHGFTKENLEQLSELLGLELHDNKRGARWAVLRGDNFYINLFEGGETGSPILGTTVSIFGAGNGLERLAEILRTEVKKHLSARWVSVDKGSVTINFHE